MKEKKWETGEDDEELFEYAMHPAQYEAYKSGKAKEDFLADVAKRRAEKEQVPTEEAKPKTLTVQVDGKLTGDSCLRRHGTACCTGLTTVCCCR